MTTCYPITDLMEAASSKANGSSRPHEIKEHLAMGCQLCSAALAEARMAVSETVKENTEQQKPDPAWMSRVIARAKKDVREHKKIEETFASLLMETKSFSSHEAKRRLLAEGSVVHPHAVVVLCREAGKYFRSDRTWADGLLDVADKILALLPEEETTHENTAHQFARAEYCKAKGALDLIYGNYKASLEWLKQAEFFYETAGDEIGIAAVLINKGVISFNLKAYEEAKQHYFLAEKIADSYDENYLHAKVIANIGNVLQEEKKWRESSERYEEAFQKFNELGDRFSAAQCIGEQGNCLSRLGHENAEKILAEAAERFKELEAMESYARALRHLGQHFARAGQDGHALGYYKQALGVFEREGAAVDQSLLSLDMARLYLKREAYDLAVSACRSAIPALEKQGLIEVREAMAYMTEALQKKKQTPELLGLLERISNFIRDASTNPELKFNLT